MNKDFKNVKCIAIGDTHSLDVVELFKRKLPTDFKTGVFIHCGDFGEGFLSEIIERDFLWLLHDYLQKIESYLIVCRGNHSNPEYFNDDHWANKTFGDRIYFAPDYSIFEINGKKIQIIGGAISIDRTDRILNISWWKDEVLKFEPEKVENVDIVISHTGPTNACMPKAERVPIIQYYSIIEARMGENLLGELAEEQKNLQILIDKSGAKMNYFGHFHKSHLYEVGGVQYRCLDIDEFKELPI